MDTVLQDLRYAVRSLLKSPGFAIVAVLTLALGIGANTAIFSVVNAVLLRPLPYADPDRLVMVWERNLQRSRDRNVISPGNYLDWRSQSRAFSDIAALRAWRANLRGVEQPEELPVEYVTGNFFRTLGVQPVLGRTFTEAEDRPGGATAVLLSYDAWQRLFGGSPGVLDRSVVLNETPRRIVGVLPAGFASPGSAALGRSGRDRPQMWLPLRLDPSQDYRTTSGRYLLAVARLKPGISVANAQGDLDVIGRRLSETYPGFDAGWDVHLIPLEEQIVGGVRRALWILAGVVAFVLLIACANVANLQLVRAAARQREFAVRAALGASRGRVVRQLLAESMLLGGIGGLAGLLLASWGTGLLSALGSAGLPRANEIRADGWTLVYTLGLSLASGILFGVVPALHASRTGLHDALREGARDTSRGSRTRGLLVGAQVALSMVLLIGAGLLIRSFDRLQAQDPGFNPEDVLTTRIQLSSARYDSTGRQIRFFQGLLERVRRVPGVRSASAITWLPFSGLGSATRIYVEGRPLPRPGEELSADIRGVDPQYFRTMQIPVTHGVPFTDADGPRTRQAIVINATMARTMFPGQDPIGQHILMPWGDTLRGEIVAVAGDAKHVALDSLARPMVYWAMSQFPSSFMTLVVRTAGDPMGLVPAIRSELKALDANQPLADVKPLAEYLGRSVAQRRFTTLLVAVFAGIALVLAAVGLYGVLAYSVSQRTREIGVRMALGARAGDVLRMVVRQGMLVVGAGVVVGIGGALALTRVMTALLYGVSATDPPTFITVVAVFGLVALVACWLPARRATRVDPMVALRSE
jgi:putative ABC transport system permease protein